MFLFTKSLVKTALQVLLYMWVTNCDAIICLIMSQMNHEPNKLIKKTRYSSETHQLETRHTCPFCAEARASFLG